MSGLKEQISSTGFILSADRTASARVAFSLGWDYAFYGLPYLFDDPEICRGAYAGQERFGAHGTKSPDRYERKWLLLRTNAWRRGRVFSERVTPAYLRRIDTEYCPVLGIKLTHGSMTESDWSVDRVNNDAAYAPGNLAVLSAKANEAKGALGFEAVLHRALASESSEGLTPGQWLKLASVMAAACRQTEQSVPVLPFIINPRDVPLLFCQYIQGVFMLEVGLHDIHVFRPLRQSGGLTRPDRDGFETLMKRIRKRAQQRPPWGEFWLHTGLFNQFARWYQGLSEESLRYVRSVLEKRVAPRRTLSRDEWCLDTFGFYRSEE